MALEKINYSFKNKGEEGYEETPLTKEITNDAYKKMDAAIDFLNKVISPILGIDRDTYSNTATYELDKVVVYQNVLYYCTTAITEPEEFNSEHWKEFKIFNFEDIEEVVVVSEENTTEVKEAKIVKETTETEEIEKVEEKERIDEK